MIVIIFITPNFAEGYYESSWNLIDSDSQNNYNAAIIDENGDAWVFGDDGKIIFRENTFFFVDFTSGLCTCAPIPPLVPTHISLG